MGPYPGAVYRPVGDVSGDRSLPAGHCPGAGRLEEDSPGVLENGSWRGKTGADGHIPPHPSSAIHRLLFDHIWNDAGMGHNTVAHPVCPAARPLLPAGEKRRGGYG